MKTQIIRYFLILISLSTFTNTQMNAATYIWNGDGDGMSWADPDNWDLDAVPTIDDDVRIENIADEVTVEGGSYGAKSIYLLGDLIIHAGDDLNVKKSLGAGIEMIGFAKLIINGILIIQDSFEEGVLSNDDGSVTVSNTGELFIVDSGEDGIKNGILINNNIVTIEGKNNGLTAGLSCTTINDGTINIEKFGAGIIHPLSSSTTNNSVINIEECVTGINGKITNSGTINMKNIIGGDGFRLNSASTIVKNFGDIYFEDVTYLISGYYGSSFTNEASGTITSTNPTSILTVSAFNFAGEFDFTNNGTIDLCGNINRVVEMAFDPVFPDCDCEFINNGTISVTDAATGWNFNDNASFFNNAGAVLTMDIDHTFVFHLINSQLQNSGTITTNLFTSVDDHIELLTGSTFSNELGGVMTLKGGQDGITNQFSNSTATNTGSITISDMDRGINSSNNNTFSNLSSGALNIFNATIFSIAGEINNDGNINISGSNTSVGISGPIVNTGDIEISNYGGGGIVSADMMNSGIITISDLQGISIVCAGTSVNSGTINLTDCGTTNIHLREDFTFSNSGTINISGTLASRGILTLNESIFTNETSGNINIEGTLNSGMSILTNSTFVNLGDLDIENCTSYGIFTSHDTNFTNESAGNISISATNTGIRSIVNSIFNNNGIITVNALGENSGLHLRDSATVNNNADGLITVTNADVQGLFVDESSKFNNYGEFNLESNQSGITNASIINNDGILKIENHNVIGIDNSESTSIFNNNSDIDFIKTSDAKDIRNVVGALFNNNGTITAKLKTLLKILNFTFSIDKISSFNSNIA